MAEITKDIRTSTNHNVYILGAGFSADAGLPVLNEFLTKMRAAVDWLSLEPTRQTEFEAVKEVFRFRKEASGAALRVKLNIENIEDLFSLAAASGKYPLSQSVSTAIATTLDYSRRHAEDGFFSAVVDKDLAIPESWTVIDDGPTSARHKIPVYDLYCGLLSGAFCASDPSARNSIITFNYDTVLEDALSALGVSYDYGFKSESVSYDASKHCGVPGSKDSLRILKLHGSVNWAAPVEGDDKLTVFGGYDEILASNRRVFLIPPTWRRDFSGALSDIWDEAVNALSEATRVVFIGFSIPPTDIHIKYLLAAGLQNNISLERLLCFNPDPAVEANLFNVVKTELRDFGIASFLTNTMMDVLLKMRGYSMLSAEFNRSLTPKIRDVRPA